MQIYHQDERPCPPYSSTQLFRWSLDHKIYASLLRSDQSQDYLWLPTSCIPLGMSIPRRLRTRQQRFLTDHLSYSSLNPKLPNARNHPRSLLLIAASPYAPAAVGPWLSRRTPKTPPV